MTPETAVRLKQAVGPKGFSEDQAELAPHLHEWRSKYEGRSPLLLKPATTEEVSAILAICHETDTAVVPQGGNTGLVGAQIPFHGEVLLSTERLNRIRALDVPNASLTAEAGVILAEAQRAADDAGLMLPLSLAAEGSCTIGGNLSTNAGGVNVVRYGMARAQVLGVEAVLADGRVLDMLRTLRKDNTGYDLKQLFIGAEGTLGIVTAAALRLMPKPAMRRTAFVAVPDVQAAIDLLARLQAASGGLVNAFELIPRLALEFVLAHIPGTADPLSAPAPWYVLTEMSGPEGLETVFDGALEAAIEAGLVSDAAIASSEAQRAALWKIRETLPEAEKKESASLKHDVSVPVTAIPAYIEACVAAVAKVLPEGRPLPFGHAGDGNIHFNFQAPRGAPAEPFLAHWDEVSRIVHDITADFGGSFSAEHGVGVLKRADLKRYRSAAEIDVMRSLKHTLDPKNILNPGKTLPD